MDYITTSQAGAILGLDGSQVRRLIIAGKLSAERVNDRLQLLKRADVERFAAEHPRSRRGRPKQQNDTR